MHFKSKKGTTDPVLSFRQAISLPYKYCKTDHDVPTHDLFVLMCAVAGGCFDFKALFTRKKVTPCASRRVKDMFTNKNSQLEFILITRHGGYLQP